MFGLTKSYDALLGEAQSLARDFKIWGALRDVIEMGRLLTEAQRRQATRIESLERVVEAQMGMIERLVSLMEPAEPYHETEHKA